MPNSRFSLRRAADDGRSEGKENQPLGPRPPRKSFSVANPPQPTKVGGGSVIAPGERASLGRNTSALGIDFSQTAPATRLAVEADNQPRIFKLAGTDELAPNKKRTLTQFQSGKFSLSTKPSPEHQLASVAAAKPPIVQAKALSSELQPLLTRGVFDRGKPFSLRLTRTGDPLSAVAANAEVEAAPIAPTSGRLNKLLSFGRNADSVLSAKKPSPPEASGMDALHRGKQLARLKPYDRVLYNQDGPAKACRIQVRFSSELQRRHRAKSEARWSKWFDTTLSDGLGNVTAQLMWHLLSRTALLRT